MLGTEQVNGRRSPFLVRAHQLTHTRKLVRTRSSIPKRRQDIIVKNVTITWDLQQGAQTMVGSLSRLSNPNFRRVLPAFVTLFLWNVSWSATITGPVLPLYIESLGIGIAGWSGLAATLALGTFLCEWVWGSLADRIDRKHLLVFSLLSMSGIFVLYARHGSFFFFLVLQLISGAVGVAVAPMTRASILGESSSQSAGLFASVWWVFASGGQIIGPLIGTYIAQIGVRVFVLRFIWTEYTLDLSRVVVVS